jgi:hypothetical protein
MLLTSFVDLLERGDILWLENYDAADPALELGKGAVVVPLVLSFDCLCHPL